MAYKKVNTATLIRGTILSLRLPDFLQKGTQEEPPMRFEYGKPVVISDAKLLDFLEDMYDEIEDGEGEVYEKPTFRVNRGVEEPTSKNTRKPKRLSAERQVKTRRRRKV